MVADKLCVKPLGPGRYPDVYQVIVCIVLGETLNKNTNGADKLCVKPLGPGRYPDVYQVIVCIVLGETLNKNTNGADKLCVKPLGPGRYPDVYQVIVCIVLGETLNKNTNGADKLCVKPLGPGRYPDVYQLDVKPFLGLAVTHDVSDQALTDGNEAEIRRRTRVVQLEDPCHPCYANPWVQGRVQLGDLHKALVFNEAYGEKEVPLLGVYFGEGRVQLGDLHKALVFNKAYGEKEVPLLGVYLGEVMTAGQDASWCDEVVVVGDPTRCLATCVNSVTTWTSPHGAERVDEGQTASPHGAHGPREGQTASPPGAHGPREGQTASPHGAHGPREGQTASPPGAHGPREGQTASPPGPHGPREGQTATPHGQGLEEFPQPPPGSPRADTRHSNTYECNHQPCNCARYQGLKGNIEIVYLVHKHKETITPVIVFIKRKGVAVQPGDEAIGDWADPLFFEIVAANLKGYQEWKRKEDKILELEDENQILRGKEDKLHMVKDENQILRGENQMLRGHLGTHLTPKLSGASTHTCISSRPLPLGQEPAIACKIQQGREGGNVGRAVSPEADHAPLISLRSVDRGDGSRIPASEQGEDLPATLGPSEGGRACMHDQQRPGSGGPDGSGGSHKAASDGKSGESHNAASDQKSGGSHKAASDRKSGESHNAASDRNQTDVKYLLDQLVQEKVNRILVQCALEEEKERGRDRQFAVMDMLGCDDGSASMR
eukprot:gene19195-25813_t